MLPRLTLENGHKKYLIHNLLILYYAKWGAKHLMEVEDY